MSAPEGGGRAGGAGRGQRPSATPGALPAAALSVGSASSRTGGGAALLAAAALTPGAAEQQPAPYSPPPAAPGAADAPRAGLAALSLLTPVPGNGAASGGGASATRPVPPTAATSRGADGASSSPDAGTSAALVTPVARVGGVPGPSATAASPTPAGDAWVPGDGPPVPVGDDGLPLSAAAAASPFSPPASERHAAFLKLVDSASKAGLQRRHMRGADFSSLAAEAGVPLFGGDSLIVTGLQSNKALGLSNQSSVEPDRAEVEALDRSSWVVLLAQALPVLQSRMDTDTLLPGKLRKVEEAYKMYEMQLAYRVQQQPGPDVATLQRYSRLMGYETALRAAFTALLLLPLHPWRSDERGRVQAFVLAALRLIPKTAGLPYLACSELQLVDWIERCMTPVRYGAEFCASVLALWRSRAVLQSRGSLQADVAKRGLRRCALPSCGKQESTVLQFRVCGHCQTTRYCCPEHAKQHWKVHKRESAEEEGEAGGGSAGMGAAA